MGVLVRIPFETPQGIPLETVYIRIVSLTYDILAKVAEFKVCAYLSRDKRIQGYSEIEVPRITNTYTFASQSIPTMDALYWAFKRRLPVSADDVLEEGQETVEPPPEPTPVVEPFPEATVLVPVSEPAPAPEETVAAPAPAPEETVVEPAPAPEETVAAPAPAPEV